METGLLNFHDEETFTTSIYDQGDLSGIDGRSSLLDMMHSDLQYSSDYLNQSAVHWDSDQEQEHNGDLAVLPVAPSECSSINSSKEDYHKGLFEWQDNLLSFQPLDPDVVDMRLDSHVIPTELPDNIFDDSYESNSSTISNAQKPILPVPTISPPRCSTPNLSLSGRETLISSDGSLNLDMSLSALDVNVSDIDVSALGINVSSLDIKTDSANAIDSKAFIDCDHETIDKGDNHCIEKEKSDEKVKGVKKEVQVPSKSITEIKSDPVVLPTSIDWIKKELVDDHEFVALFGAPETNKPFQSCVESVSQIVSQPGITNTDASIHKLQVSDVEQLHDLAMEFINEEQQAKAWDSLPLISSHLDSSLSLEPANIKVPALEAGNLESLLEQFEATLKPTVDFSQSMPASPSHSSIPPSPLSMPASPSCIALTTPLAVVTNLKTENMSPPLSPSHSLKTVSTPKKVSSPAKGKSVLHQNILETLPVEVLERIKAPGRKKAIPLIPAMPTKKLNKSGTRMHAAGATLNRNKLLKLVSHKGGGGERVQFDHDYCSNDSSLRELVPEKSIMGKKVSSKLKELDDERSSRKDSGLESGDVSEDSDSTILLSGASSGCETGSSSCKSNVVSILKPRKPQQPVRNKEMLMVSVLKKVRCDVTKSHSTSVPTHQTNQVFRPINSTVLKSNVKPIVAFKPDVACRQPAIPPVKSIKSPEETDVKCGESNGSLVKHLIPVKPPLQVTKVANTSLVKPVEVSVKAQEVSVKSEPLAKPAEQCKRPDVPKETSADVNMIVPLPEQPKKRKLNLEEYRNRQRAMKQERESKTSENSPVLEISIKKEPTPDETSTEKEQKPDTTHIKKEPTPEKPVFPTLGSDEGSKSMEEAKKPELITIADGGDSVQKPAEEKRQRRQYRSRQLSSSSSEGSPQPKEVCKTRDRRKNFARKSVWAKTRSRSRSMSSSSSQSRNGSTRSRSSNSSSSSSSRSSRSRSRNRSRSSSRNSSSSSRRSNSISSGSSRHSKHSSRSRRSKLGSRSRSRSQRRSRRRRSRSASRSSRSSGWRRRGRDSSSGRGSFRRGRSQIRSGWRKSWSSTVSWSRSRSRSLSCRRRSTYRSRSPLGRRLCSFSSQSEFRSRPTSQVGYHSSQSRSYSPDCDLRHRRSRNRSRFSIKSTTEGQRKSGSSERTKKKSWRSRSPMWRNVDWSRVEKEQNRNIEERRVIYVGRIPEDTTKAELRRRFEVFGPILDISLHFREHADNYGFVTFAYKVDAYEAVERGNDDPTQPHYELCFGGRRKFCRERYADLDGMACKSSTGNVTPYVSRGNEGNSFDDMLREVQAKLQARKKR